MRKILCIIMLLVLLTGAALADTLQNGSQGDEVKRVQERLTELGYKVGKPDGIYGKMTATAVRDFQGENGLEQTGKVDERTNRYLFELSPLAEGQMRLFHAFTGYKAIQHKVNWGQEMSSGVLYHLPILQEKLSEKPLLVIATMSEGMGMMELYSGSVYTAFGSVKDGASFYIDFFRDAFAKVPESEVMDICFIYYDLKTLEATYFIPTLEASDAQQRCYNDLDSFIAAIA